MHYHYCNLKTNLNNTNKNISIAISYNMAGGAGAGYFRPESISKVHPLPWSATRHIFNSGAWQDLYKTAINPLPAQLPLRWGLAAQATCSSCLQLQLPPRSTPLPLPSASSTHPGSAPLPGIWSQEEKIILSKKTDRHISVSQLLGFLWFYQINSVLWDEYFKC